MVSMESCQYHHGIPMVTTNKPAQDLEATHHHVLTAHSLGKYVTTVTHGKQDTVCISPTIRHI